MLTGPRRPESPASCDEEKSQQPESVRCVQGPWRQRQGRELPIRQKRKEHIRKVGLGSVALQPLFFYPLLFLRNQHENQPGVAMDTATAHVHGLRSPQWPRELWVLTLIFVRFATGSGARPASTPMGTALGPGGSPGEPASGVHERGLRSR